MQKIELAIMRLVVSAVIPILLFLAGWWGSIGRVPENMIFVVGLSGLGVGVLIDIIFLRKFIKNLYGIDTLVLVLIYIFYSICTLGFFMGVPIFNLIPGIIAGYFMGRKLKYSKLYIGEVSNNIRRVSVFTTVTMFIISSLSAYIVLIDPADTARNLQGMFNIKLFTITTPMIIGIIIVGGMILLFLQYWLTKITAIKAYKRDW